MNVYSPRRYGYRFLHRERRRRELGFVVVYVVSTFAVFVALVLGMPR